MPDPENDPALWPVDTCALTGGVGFSSSITIDEITWHLDRPYKVEEVANGKYIVRPELANGSLSPNGRVVVTGIAPNPNPGRHGSMVNPSMDIGYTQAYDDRTLVDGFSQYNPALAKSLPIYLLPGQALVSTRSLSSSEYTGSGTRLKDAAVLVCMARELDGGAAVHPTTIRPPYVTNSTIGNWTRQALSTTTTNIQNLPSLSYQGGLFYLQTGDVNPYVRYTDQLRKDWLVHAQGSLGGQLHPMNNMPQGWYSVGRVLSDAMVLAFVTNPTTVPNGSGGFCTTSQRQSLLNALLEKASDYYWAARLIGNRWWAEYQPGPNSADGTFASDESSIQDLIYLFAHLYNLPKPYYQVVRPDGQCFLNSAAQSLTVSSSSSASPVMSAPVAVSPSVDAQVMIGTGETFDPVSPNLLPSSIEKTHLAYSWVGEVAESTRNPGKMVLWSARSERNPVKVMSEHLNPREWVGLQERGGVSDGNVIEEERRKTIAIFVGPVLCGQLVMGKTGWEAWRGAPAFLDYIERWMYRENSVHLQNEAYVQAVLSADGQYTLGGLPTPGKGSSAFVTNMFYANYEVI